MAEQNLSSFIWSVADLRGIADEAPSSQSGDAAAKLKAVLSPEELKELEDGGEVSAEDVLAA